MVFIAEELDILVYWMVERERVRRNRELGWRKPWTIDPLLRDYRWCNVRRMDDLVSRELMLHWYRQDMSVQEAFAAATMARMINWLPSLEAVLLSRDCFTLEATAPGLPEMVLKARAAAGHKIFTAAYVVPGRPGEDKVDTVMRVVRNVRDIALADIFAPTMRESWHNLLGVDGLGGFLAGQIVADLAFVASIGAGWPDARTWAPLGPGSRRGMNRLLGRPAERPMGQEEFEPVLAQLRSMPGFLPTETLLPRDMVAMDVQNCLCEFDKYRRLTLREGTVRSGYPGRADSTRMEL